MREYTIQIWGLTFTLGVSRTGARFGPRVITRDQAAALLRSNRQYGAVITRTEV